MKSFATMFSRRFRRFFRCLGPAYFVTSVLLFLLSAYMFLSVYITMPQIEKRARTDEQPGPFRRLEGQVLGEQSGKLASAEGHESKRRQNLIIVAHGRSGSSFTGNIFNHHPSVFYLFEPYQTAERLHGKLEPFNRDYEKQSFEWMQGVLQCKFVSAKHADDLQHYYRKVMKGETKDTQPSIALSSPPFCRYSPSDPKWNLRDACPDPFEQKMLEEACEKNYSMTVVKALMGRMPNTSIGQLISLCDSSTEFDCKVLFLVRDPRAIIPSSKATNFYRDTDRIGLSETRKFSYQNCKNTELNLNIIKSLPPRWKKRIKILRYEDLALNPSKLLPGLLQFARLPMDDGLSNWLYLASHKPKTESEQRAAPWRLESSEGANRWRWKVSPYEIAIIERYCSHVMKVLGYKPLDLSYDMQRNLTVNLLADEFEALRWLRDSNILN